MPRALAPSTLMLTLTSSLFLSGCCGGYAVVRTTVQDHAEMRPGAAGEVRRGDAFILHYSRLGEPPNDCGGDTKYLEDLRIRVPSMRVGETFVLGTAGVVAWYTREQAGSTVPSKSVTGTLHIKEQSENSVAVTLDITITLPSGEVVALDDDYFFHPARGEGAAWIVKSCRF